MLLVLLDITVLECILEQSLRNFVVHLLNFSFIKFVSAQQISCQKLYGQHIIDFLKVLATLDASLLAILLQ